MAYGSSSNGNSSSSFQAGRLLGALSRAYTVAVTFAFLLLLYHQHGQPDGAGSSSAGGRSSRASKQASTLQVQLGASMGGASGGGKDVPRRLAESLGRGWQQQQVVQGQQGQQQQQEQQTSRWSAQREERQAAGSSSGSGSMLTPQLDLALMLGWDHALSSVSTLAWMAYKCFPPMAEAYKGGDLTAVQVKLTQHLVQTMARLKGVREKDIDISVPYPQALGLADLREPLLAEWREALGTIMAGYYIDGRWKREGHRFCCSPEPNEPATLANLGRLACDTQEALQCGGIGSGSMLTLWGINSTVHNVLYEGVCTDPPAYKHGLADLLVKDRMLSPEWHTFPTKDLHSDAAVFQFQLLYEHMEMFRRQKWLGVTALQNPMDSWSIQDLIHSIRPGLIIETGTANGGSALLWASVLELSRLQDSRVVTIDPRDPSAVEWSDKGGAEREPLAADHWLWDKYVTFVQGKSLDAHVMAQVSRMVQDVEGPVLVVLDSDHAEEAVYQEASKYCALVTVGSYCIVQDTKMSRFGWTGPLPAVRQFLSEHPNFESDRSRELLFTDHSFGYLKRSS